MAAELSSSAEITMTGTDRSAGFSRIALSTSKPLMPGIITSSSTRSKPACANSSRHSGRSTRGYGVALPLQHAAQQFAIVRIVVHHQQVPAAERGTSLDGAGAGPTNSIKSRSRRAACSYARDRHRARPACALQKGRKAAGKTFEAGRAHGFGSFEHEFLVREILQRSHQTPLLARRLPSERPKRALPHGFPGPPEFL